MWKGVCRIRKSIWCICNADRTSPHYPECIAQFVVYFTTGIASAILSVSSFAFLGVGLIAGTPEWGAMLNDARNSIYTNPALIVYPGICLIICCAGFNLLGEGIRDFIGKEDQISVS